MRSEPHVVRTQVDTDNVLYRCILHVVSEGLNLLPLEPLLLNLAPLTCCSCAICAKTLLSLFVLTSLLTVPAYALLQTQRCCRQIQVEDRRDGDETNASRPTNISCQAFLRMFALKPWW